MFNNKAWRWRNAGKYLPKFMRDFHDQKDLFKNIERQYGPHADISWAKNHIYVIDYFLWFMAQHGYTLQKVRGAGNKEFDDIDETLSRLTEERRKEEAQALGMLLEKKDV